MKHRRRFALVALVATLIASSAAAPAAAATDASDPTIVYSDAYLRLIAAFPSGWVPNACEGAAFLAGGGICTAEFNPAYFYPDGTFGKMAWYVDPSSPAGWSIEPDPCEGLTDDEYTLWATYVDFHNGYLETGPSLTDRQVDRYGACWGWWF